MVDKEDMLGAHRKVMKALNEFCHILGADGLDSFTTDEHQQAKNSYRHKK